jgi:uncharacterized protein YjbI with pentapeptide repeats
MNGPAVEPRDERCRHLIDEARGRRREGQEARARSLFSQAATLAEERGVNLLEKNELEGYPWMLDAMVYWGQAGKPVQVIRIYRRIRGMLRPPQLAVKADLLTLSALHRLRDQLSFVDMSGLRLGRLNLQGANLTGAILRYSELTGTNLRGANLKGANMEGAKFTDVDLQDAQMARTYWRGAHLRRVKMAKGMLEGALLIDTQMEGIDLTEAILHRAVLNRSNLRRACLVGAQLDGAKLEGTRMANADLRRSTFTRATLEEVDLAGAQLDGAQFDGATLIKVNFDGVIDRKTVFAGATVSGGVVRGVTRAAMDPRHEGMMVREINFQAQRVDKEPTERRQVLDSKVNRRDGDVYEDFDVNSEENRLKTGVARRIFGRFRR